MIDFKRAEESEHVVQRLEYDPNRSAWIALLKNTKNARVLFSSPFFSSFSDAYKISCVLALLHSLPEEP